MVDLKLRERFAGFILGKKLSYDELSERAGVEYLTKHGLLGERLSLIADMSETDFIEWSASWCQSALAWLRIRNDYDSFDRTLAFLENFEALYLPLRNQIEEEKTQIIAKYQEGILKALMKKGETPKENENLKPPKEYLESQIPFDLKDSFNKISYRMVTDGKLLLGLSFDKEDVDAKTLIINKAYVPVQMKGGFLTPTEQIVLKTQEKPSSSPAPRELSEDI